MLTTPSGYVLEGATSSLLWWEGDRLCVPDPHLRVLPSVTATLVRWTAEEHGIEVRRRRRRVHELAGREVWVVNALHGIRPVMAVQAYGAGRVGWIGTDVAVGQADRAPAWHAWWRGSAKPLDPRP